MMKHFFNRKAPYIISSVLLLTLFAAGCNANNPANNTTNDVADEMPTAEVIPSATATLEPTLEPTPVPTEIPTEIPTETPVPELGLTENGIEFWTIPLDSGVMTIDMIGTADDYVDPHIGYMEEGVLNVQVPGTYVVAEVHFNQPLPSGTKFQVFELGAVSPWFEATFSMDANDGNSGILLINHQYIINPPFWEITYHVKIVDGTGKVFWENDLRIFKALPNTCWDGSLPDPVTLYCKSYDGDWNYRDFPNFNPDADKFASGDWEIDDEYLP
jgi:hypothetical protein